MLHLLETLPPPKTKLFRLPLLRVDWGSLSGSFPSTQTQSNVCQAMPFQLQLSAVTII